ncbi:MAG: SDR family NAD(P)-dependent oxidoreductase [Gammaproteobacteria bacterium]|nr:MAG: SDR family NAD(P)-dependent oxidoreductase [Gammaproteobacteria bacterium]
MQIDGMAALVTGAGSGLGAATARMLAGRGARVALLDMDIDAARAQAKPIAGLALACDVSDADQAEQAVAAARAEHGDAGILVNCAGIAPARRVLGRDGPMPLAEFDTVIRVNLVGTFNLLRLAAAGMAALEPQGDDGERGVIVNTASVSAFEGQIGQAAYSASKAGVAGMTLPVARELARIGVRVMTIAPGLMSTPMLHGMPQEVQESLGAQVPFPARLGHPEEYAALVAHIVENSMLNGEVIRLDGAVRMQPK